MPTVVERLVDLHLPADEVRMVLMQPNPHDHLIGPEPFKWADASCADQFDRIRRCLDIAKGPSVAHFTIFPEYSVPGLEGVELIQSAIDGDEWGSNSVIIAGVDGLTKTEYSTLCGHVASNVEQCNAPNELEDSNWVNCCVTWTKSIDGTVQRWVQPKLEPAWLESNLEHKDLFRGSAVYLFQGLFEGKNVPWRFFSLVCFDLVGHSNNELIINELLSGLNDAWAGGRKEIHWAFVLQYNDKPNHSDFLDRTREVLTNNAVAPSVNRDHLTVVLANSALLSSTDINGGFGFTSLIYGPSAAFDSSKLCRPSYCSQTQTIRATNCLKGYHDAVFREMTSCIHEIIAPVSLFVQPLAAQRRHSISNARVHSIDGNSEPRKPGSPVPAVVKRVNDWLDVVPSLGDDIVNETVAQAIGDAESVVCGEFRILDSQRLERAVKAASRPDSYGGSLLKTPFPSVDEWDASEEKALEYLIQLLALAGIGYPVDVNGSTIHAVTIIHGSACNIVVVRGRSHKLCAEYFRQEFADLVSESEYVLLLTRDKQNRPFLPEFGKSILDAGNESADMSAGPNIANSSSSVRQLGFANLFDACIDSADALELPQRIASCLDA